MAAGRAAIVELTVGTTAAADEELTVGTTAAADEELTVGVAIAALFTPCGSCEAPTVCRFTPACLAAMSVPPDAGVPPAAFFCTKCLDATCSAPALSAAIADDEFTVGVTAVARFATECLSVDCTPNDVAEELTVGAMTAAALGEVDALDVDCVPVDDKATFAGATGGLCGFAIEVDAEPAANGSADFI